MSYRNSITITNYDVLIPNIVRVHEEILKIRGNVMYGTRIKNPIVGVT